MQRMNFYAALAGLVLVLTGLMHSVLGERLIFRRMRAPGALIPTEGGSALREPHVRILWATWHALSVIGWAVAAVLFWYSRNSQRLPEALAWILATGLLGGAALVLIGTKGRHPGWIALSVAAVLTCLS